MRAYAFILVTYYVNSILNINNVVFVYKNNDFVCGHHLRGACFSSYLYHLYFNKNVPFFLGLSSILQILFHGSVLEHISRLCRCSYFLLFPAPPQLRNIMLYPSVSVHSYCMSSNIKTRLLYIYLLDTFAQIYMNFTLFNPRFTHLKSRFLSGIYCVLLDTCCSFSQWKLNASYQNKDHNVLTSICTSFSIDNLNIYLLFLFRF